jgi:SpoVK/Ycf46/Vps4 family AAA+-type ATPase
MATSSQIKMLIQAHIENNDLKFRTAALQIAATEAQNGHATLAREIKELIDKSQRKVTALSFNKVNGLFSEEFSRHSMDDLVLSNELMSKLNRVIHEYKKSDILRNHGLSNRRKLLLVGPPGTGKTMTAGAIASELNLPLFTIQTDKLITKFMGETGSRLRQVFDSISSVMGVYFFDEFDAVGSDRSLDNDVGEMRRVLNSFLQFMETDESYSIIIAATNNPNLLDEAVFRRFDDIWQFGLPSVEETIQIIDKQFVEFCYHPINSTAVISAANGLSHAEIVNACSDAAKHALLSDTKITDSLLVKMLKERKSIFRIKEA